MNFKYILTTFLLLNTMHSWAMLNRVAHNSIKNEITQKNARALIQLKRNFYTANGHFFYDCELAEQAYLMALSIPAGLLAAGLSLEVIRSVSTFIDTTYIDTREPSTQNKKIDTSSKTADMIAATAGGALVAHAIGAIPGVVAFGASLATVIYLKKKHSEMQNEPEKQ